MISNAEFEFQNRKGNPGSSIKRISWAAVFAGVLIAIVIQLTLSLLGLGIGLSTIDPKVEENPIAGLGTGTAIWYGLSSLLSLFAGGWIAGRLARTPKLFDGIIHGILAWALITIVMLYFLTTTLGSIFGGIGRLAGGVLQTAGSAASNGIAAAAPMLKDELKDQGFDIGNLKKEAEKLLKQTGKAELQPNALEKKADKAASSAKSATQSAASNPQATGDVTDGLLDNLFNQGKDVTSALDKDAMVNVIMARTGKSRSEADTIANNWIATYKEAQVKWDQTKQQAEQKAREIGDQAAKAASTAAIFAFISLVLGVVVAGFGAKLGTTSKEPGTDNDRVIAT